MAIVCFLTPKRSIWLQTLANLVGRLVSITYLAPTEIREFSQVREDNGSIGLEYDIDSSLVKVLANSNSHGYTDLPKLSKNEVELMNADRMVW